MYCRNCGQEIAQVKFCPSCGTAVDSSLPSLNEERCPKGDSILLLGILGLVIFAPLGIIAWIKGNRAIRQYPYDQNVKLGRLLGMTATIIMIASIIIMGLFFAASIVSMLAMFFSFIALIFAPLLTLI